MLYQVNPENASPSKPQNLQGNKNAELAVALSWTANAEPDVLTGGGYNIYRAYYYTGGPSPAYVKINASLVTSSSFVNNDFSGVSVPAGTSVSLRYRVTAVDNTSKESVRSDSSQITYTASEFGRALGYQGRSDNPGATAFNNQRKLYRDSATKIHEVFESGGEVFYRESGDNGVTWQITKQLSDGSGTNASPSITGRYDEAHDRTNVFAVWQKGTAPNYSIIYDYSLNAGTTWLTSPSTIATCSSPGPTPSICASTPNNALELMVVYTTNTNLRYAYSTNRTSWSLDTVAYTYSGSRDPSLAYDEMNYAYFRLAWASGGVVKHQTWYPSAWQIPTTVNSGIAGTIHDNFYTSYALSGNEDKHITWEALDGWQRVIIENKNLNPSVYSEFYAYYNHCYRPSVTGHDNGRMSLMWSEAGSSIKKVTYTGSGWNSVETLGSGQYPASSLNNPPGGPALAIWTEGTTLPYTVRVGPSGGMMQKVGSDATLAGSTSPWSYSRRLVLSTPNGDQSVSIELEPPSVGNSVVPLVPVNDTMRYDPSSIWSVLASGTYSAPSGPVTMKVKRSIGSKISTALQNTAFTAPIVFELIDASSEKTLAQVPFQVIASDSELVSKDELQLSANLTAAMAVRFRVRPSTPLSTGKMQAAVIQVYRVMSDSAGSSNKLTAQAKERPQEFRLDECYPNPFNPTTTLSYALPEAGQVSLVIYDILGRRVAELASGQRESGHYTETWSGTNAAGSTVASGVYFVRFTVRDEFGRITFMKVNKLLLMK